MDNDKVMKIGSLIASLFFGGSSMYVYHRLTLEEPTKINQELFPREDKQENNTVQIIERVVSSGQLWRPIQERSQDTVVQVFSQVAATDLLQPYKTPAQGTSCGTGFFINDQGELITNAHVINEAKAVWVQIPSLGKRIIDVDIVSVSPDRDLALLRLTPDSLRFIQRELGSVPYLPLGDSDLVRRADEVLALGYPLGQQALKSTTGVVSGRESNLIQISAPINPGSSGGPLVNAKGEVVGINSSGVMEAQNVGYAIPINDLKIVLPDMYKVPILRKPFLGMLFNNSTEALTQYLGNPEPGGCYIVEVVKNSTLDKAGVRRGDVLYQLNGYQVDMFGEMRVPWSEDKISVVDYVSRLSIGQDIAMTVYRNGERKEFSVKFMQNSLPAIHEIYPGFEGVDYEIVGGMVVMQLSLNHLPLLGNRAPGLVKFTEAQNQTDPILIITHMFPNSQLYRSRSLPVGATINEINDIKVRTLAEFREALKVSLKTNFLTIRASDNVTRKSDNIFAVLPWHKVIDEEVKLSQDFRYPITQHTREMIRIAQAGQTLSPTT